MINRSKIQGLDWLINVAKRSPGRYRHSAGLFTKSGKLIVATHNVYDAHAEQRVIQKYFAVDKYRRERASYIVVIRLSNGATTLVNSQPCIKCNKLLQQLNIRIIHS